MNRVRYFDSLRLLAIFVVYVTHFTAYFHSDYFVYWKTAPTSYILEGVTGKLGVALFGVLLGYFAYLSKGNDAVQYTIKRYGYFVISGFIINTLYMLAGEWFAGRKQYTFEQVLKASFTLDDAIFATYWCIPVFFVASIVSYLNGKAKTPTPVLLVEIYMLYKLNMVWLAVCLMGNVVARYSLNPRSDILRYRLVRIVLWIVLFFAIKRKESNETYMIQGACCALMVMLISRGTIVKSALNLKCFSKIGEQGMGIYILHPLVYSIFGKWMFPHLDGMPYKWAFLLTLFVCFAVTAALSFPTVWVINTATKYIGVVYDKARSAEWRIRRRCADEFCKDKRESTEDETASASINRGL